MKLQRVRQRLPSLPIADLSKAVRAQMEQMVPDKAARLAAGIAGAARLPPTQGFPQPTVRAQPAPPPIPPRDGQASPERVYPEGRS